MRTHIFYLICIFSSTHLTHAITDPLTHTIQMRYYHIARLQKMIKHAYRSTKNQEYFSEHILPAIIMHKESFQQPPVVLCIECMEAEKKIAPVFQLWQEIKQYKFVQNPHVMNEFVKLFFLIIHKLTTQTATKNPHTAYTQSLLADKSAMDIDSTQFAFRFYIINRLASSMQTLTALHKRTILFEKHKSLFHNKIIIACFDKMMQQNSIVPLLSLYGQIEQFRFIQSAFFIQEFLALVVFTYQTILNQPVETTESSPSIPSLLDTVDRLNAHYQKVKDTLSTPVQYAQEITYSLFGWKYTK